MCDWDECELCGTKITEWNIFKTCPKCTSRLCKIYERIAEKIICIENKSPGHQELKLPSLSGIFFMESENA